MIARTSACCLRRPSASWEQAPGSACHVTYLLLECARHPRGSSYEGQRLRKCGISCEEQRLGECRIGSGPAWLLHALAWITVTSVKRWAVCRVARMVCSTLLALVEQSSWPTKYHMSWSRAQMMACHTSKSPQGHQHRVIAGKPHGTLAERHRAPQKPLRDPCRGLWKPFREANFLGEPRVGLCPSDGAPPERHEYLLVVGWCASVVPNRTCPMVVHVSLVLLHTSAHRHLAAPIWHVVWPKMPFNVRMRAEPRRYVVGIAATVTDIDAMRWATCADASTSRANECNT